MNIHEFVMIFMTRVNQNLSTICVGVIIQICWHYCRFVPIEEVADVELI
jgi:hypothetical protein